MVSSLIRLRSGEKIPLLAKFKTEQEKWKVIANARAVINKNSDYKGNFVNPDLYKCEREKQYLLRQELRDRRNNGEQVVIKKGAIVTKAKNSLVLMTKQFRMV